MNCDQAFDLMTDPSLDDSPALHQHLDDCPRCQQMYETLSPALGMFECVVSGPETEDHMTGTGVEVAERVAVRLLNDVHSAKPSRRRILTAVSAAVVLGFLAAIGIAVLMPSSPSSGELLASECTWQNRSAAAEGERSDAVVLSCVACHLSPSPE